MTRVLTVDDSRAVRMLVTKQILELGFEVGEAESGEQGLEQLEASEYDLVLLDVTMPGLDGPGMLARMRENGNRTPVLMLTSESKRSIVATLMKLGIEGYILKPFKPEELRSKVIAVLGEKAGAVAPVAAAAAPPPREVAAPVVREAPVMAAARAEDAGRQFVDIMVIDDMENVSKRLRALFPSHFTMNSSTSAQVALGMCRERVYRMVLVDNDIPDVDSATLLKQLRVLQPHAVFVMLCLRTVNDAREEAKNQGFDAVLFKPFDPDDAEELMLRFFDNQELITAQDNVCRVKPFHGREGRLERYYQRLRDLLLAQVDQVAAACFAELVVDVSELPLHPDRFTRLIVDLNERSSKVGLSLRLVGGAAVTKELRNLVETAEVGVFETVEAALKG